MTYSVAWDQAIDEYNNYGANAVSAKHRIDKNSSNLMFGFKAGWVLVVRERLKK